MMKIASKKLLNLCLKSKLKVTVAESCTGGMISEAITSQAGASSVFDCSFITYSNVSKIKLLNVPKVLLEKHGSVSHEVAEAMAMGALKAAKANLSIAITGIAGPSGGDNPNKPIGTVHHFVLDDLNLKLHIKKKYKGNRENIRMQATNHAINMAIKLIAIRNKGT